jgi:alpha-tubulin suppressor-like RCC1 family protein
VGSDTGWISVSPGGDAHTCGIRQDHSLWCWGDNSELQIDGLSAASYSSPVRVAVGTWWKTIATDRKYTCGVRTDRSLWCWGFQARGDGQDVIHTIPFQVDPGSRWSAISVRNDHICGVRISGSLWCWGDNYRGHAIPGIIKAVHLKPTRVGTKSYWRAVAGGGNFTCGLRSDSSLWCWGGNGNAELGDGTRVSSWEIPIQTQIGRAANWTSLAAGTDQTCGIRADHSLWCWGGNAYGQLGDGTTTDRSMPTRMAAASGTRGWKRVGAGEHVTCAVASNGSLWCWGNLQQASTDSERVTTPVQLGVDLTWRDVAVGTERSCAITTQGAIWCWGRHYPLRGDKPYDNLVPVGTGAVWTKVTAGLLFMCGIQQDGSLWYWDEHSQPPLRPGDIPKWFETGFSPTPTQFAGNWMAVARPYSALRGIRADGSLWYSNPRGTPTPFDDHAWTTLAYDWQNTCGIRSDRTLWCSTSGPAELAIAIGPPRFWTDVSLQSGYVCGIASDHTLWCGHFATRGTDIDLENRAHQVVFPSGPRG